MNSYRKYDEEFPDESVPYLIPFLLIIALAIGSYFALKSERNKFNEMRKQGKEIKVPRW